MILYLKESVNLTEVSLKWRRPTGAMIYQLEIDDRDETAKAVLAFIRQMAATNKAINPPVALNRPELAERPFGTMKGSFKLAPDFDEPLDDLKDYV